ncbi:MAG: hypothetical protein RI922_2552 [Bacteroidota bacterium]|jgi:hypothetical protein
MKSNLVLLFLSWLIVSACGMQKTAEVSETQAIEKSQEIIVPGKGYASFELGKTSQVEIEQQLGKNYTLIKHNSYSIELVYKDLGVSFYFYQGQPERNVFSMRFNSAFEGKTDKGIPTQGTTIEEIINVYGKPQWTSCNGCYEWTARYKGIGFIVDRDTTVPQYPLDDNLYMTKTVKQIEIFEIY